ncbi:MAG: hypothetical protein H0X29_06255 [Parachlamydiaceae bacterium]|nr:hypothetical protein [Parachlamydiaceae bacterium]
MNKIFLGSLLSMMAILLFVQSTPLEARNHHGRGAHVQVGLGASVGARDAYVVRRTVRPMVSRQVVVVQDPYYAPVYAYAAPAYAAPVYAAPAPAYAAPVYAAPAYVEEVYQAPRCRPVSFGFGGLSLFFNL